MTLSSQAAAALARIARASGVRAEPQTLIPAEIVLELSGEAVRSRQVLRMLAAGGNAYYLAKLAGIFGLDMQDIGAQQTGVTKDEFKARLIAAGH